MFFACHDVWACLLSIVVTYSMVLGAAVTLRLDSMQTFSLGALGFVLFLTFVCYEGSMYLNFSSNVYFEAALRVKVASENEAFLLRSQTEDMRHMLGK